MRQQWRGHDQPEPCRGSTPLTGLFWILGLGLLALPFLGERQEADWESPDPARSDGDIPFASDVREFDTGASADDWEGYGPELAGEVGEPLLAFLAALGADVEGLDGADLDGTRAALRRAGLRVPAGGFGESSVLADLIEVSSAGFYGLQAPPAHLLDRELLETGAETYASHCAGCHAPTGDGAGPAARYLSPRPRNFRRGFFKFTSTSSGARPTRKDLFKTVTRGLAGSAMPGFPLLPEAKRWAVAEYVRYLAIRGEFEQMMLDVAWEDEELPDPTEIREIVDGRWDADALRPVFPSASEPEFDAASIERGRELFMEPDRASCFTCHGETGRGDGPSADEFSDEWGYPIRPRDFTQGVFRAGESAQEIYVSIATGIGGTPMGAFEGVMTPEEIWHLAHYSLYLAGRQPEGGE